MLTTKTHPLLLAAASGILSFIAVCQLNFVAGCICYVPLFIAMHQRSAKQVFKIAFVFALFFAIPAFFWMIPSAKRFTGSSPMYGVAVFLLSSLLYSFYTALYLFVFAWLRNKVSHAGAMFHGLLAGAVFILAEWMLSLVSAGLPWFDFHSGNPFIQNIYAIQPAALFGNHIISFVVVLLNYLLAEVYISRHWKRLWVPAGMLGIYLLAGLLLLQYFKSNLPASTPFTLGIASENIPPEIKWDEENGNRLVNQLIDLGKQAAAAQPNILLWSESAIPWTYSEDDELLKTIVGISRPANMTHILGMNTFVKEQEVLNSAYGIGPGGKLLGRYDKQQLLSFIEKPMGGMVFPFLSSNGYTASSDANHAAPIETLQGKAGVLICNEAALPSAAASQVKQGAQFLLNLSNDGWFNHTYIKQAHFYYARLRAVETRKDLAVNSNNGYCGMVKASGEIVAKESSAESFFQLTEMHPNDYRTPAVDYPNIFLYTCLLFVGILLLVRFRKA